MVQPQQSHKPPLRPVLEAYVNVTAATYTAKAGDRVIGVNRAGTVTVTLPAAEVRKGRHYTVKDESGAAATNNITVATEGAETIDGAVTGTIADNYGSVTYYSDGTNWFTIPLLPAAAHTLASHSAKAHSDLTGIGTGDHHAQAHQADHNSAGADALKLDDLAAPDDNTDLNFSTTLHGLVPKGPNTGNFLKDDGSWAAAGATSQATQAALEAETDEDTYAPPDLIKHSPGVAKAYARIKGSDGSLKGGSYNITSTARNSTGNYTVTWATDFADALYSPNVWTETASGGSVAEPITPAVGTVIVETRNMSGTIEDHEWGVTAFGDQ